MPTILNKPSTAKHAVTLRSKRSSLIYKAGTVVQHPAHGTGTIITMWGEFNGCPTCTKLISAPAKRTACCGVGSITISGRDVYDIQFRNQIIPLHSNTFTPL